MGLPMFRFFVVDDPFIEIYVVFVWKKQAVFLPLTTKMCRFIQSDVYRRNVINNKYIM
ncbi:hypothetical protein HMPREF0083_02520 [Aneurinibacillus aneurinilyticus ATCC 12856]|jgi:hypothetical protein|uniref:Uncharacterized protein n=1 Tax=Aneurinibacillus aneurinilyticus ATCC 12856 TaxID=649747 RepID=U1YF40_ANEAE|nr:hypothetical protein HMPREF0083_02520 [Aneurinibacillus aneurinilyticus ATCC 12856]